MQNGFSHLPDGLSLRPANPNDNPFIETLYASTRSDLQLLDGERGFIHMVIEQQFQAQTQSYASNHPNAMYFILEKQQERIGRVTLDFSHDGVHIVDIALIPSARGQGYGANIIAGIQHTAATIHAPVTLTVAKINLDAKRLYLKLGFGVHSNTDLHELMIWYPATPTQKV